VLVHSKPTLKSYIVTGVLPLLPLASFLLSAFSVYISPIKKNKIPLQEKY
jgi:hypothetical protein